MEEKINFDDPATMGSALLGVAARFVDLSTQILHQTKKGSLPGLERNRAIAIELGSKAVGHRKFMELVRSVSR